MCTALQAFSVLWSATESGSLDLPTNQLAIPSRRGPRLRSNDSVAWLFRRSRLPSLTSGPRALAQAERHRTTRVVKSRRGIVFSPWLKTHCSPNTLQEGLEGAEAP